MTVRQRVRRIPLLVLLLVLTVVASACGQPDPELMTPESTFGADPSGRILFVAGGEVRLWEDGDISQITDLDDEVEAQSPSWAPDGTRFAYVRLDRSLGYSDLYVAGLDGETLKQVTSNAPDFDPHSQEFACYAYWVVDPVWDPGGERIIWASDRGGWEWDLCADRLSDPMFLWYSETWDAEPYLLEATAGLGRSQESPTLSSDGQMAAFVVRVDITDSLRNTQVWTLDLNTAETDVLVDHPGGAYDPAWSPDGDNVAYVQRDSNRNDIWIAPVDGSEPYRLTDVGTCVSPTWSPDGQFISFFRERDGNFEAAYVEVEAGSDGKLTAGEPQRLFSAENISTISGMSWTDS